MNQKTDHFALEWVKSELLETLNQARGALEAYAEGDRDAARLRVCLTSMHQVHGTLVMLELVGVTLLADHLERLSQAMHHGKLEQMNEACQLLMQGILELPGLVEEIQRGAPDTTRAVTPLVNQIRGLLGEEALPERSNAFSKTAGEDVLRRFREIDGPVKIARIRSAYQNVLLNLLKGEGMASALGTLEKVALGLCRVCEGSPLEAQWQAFAEFVDSIKGTEGPLEADVVKLLRRVDAEIKKIAQQGAAALQQPVSMELVNALLQGASERQYESARLSELKEASSDAGGNHGLTISGRQAMASAAGALREELALVKDKLDLYARSKSSDKDQLQELLQPLKQMASTLSLLGFESSRGIVLDQLDRLADSATVGNRDAVFGIARALLQVDESLLAVAEGSEATELERLTTNAQRQVVKETRAGLESVKQSVVDFVSARFDANHLKALPALLAELSGALSVVPLARASALLADCKCYVERELLDLGGDAPDWTRLDAFADAVSGVDYYLERLAEHGSVSDDDALEFVERSLTSLGFLDAHSTSSSPATEVAVPVASAIVEEEPAELTEVVAAVDVPADTPFELVFEAEAEAEAPESEPLTDIAAGIVDLDAISDEEALPELEVHAPEEDAFDLSAEDFAQLDDVVEREGLVTDLAPAESDEPVAESTEPVMAAAVHDDPEIVEIFVEEVAEVLEAVGAWLPRWEAAVEVQAFNEEALTEVRRSFHTLKGSGRMVGAAALGEIAWSIENMLNRVLDQTVEATDEFVQVTRAAATLVGTLTQQFATGAQADLEAVGALVDDADTLASGGMLQAAQSADEPEEVAFADTELSADPAVEPVVAEDENEDDDLRLFIEEARMHFATIAEQWLHEPNTNHNVVVNDDVLLGLHTLVGGAGLMGFDGLREHADLMYDVARALRDTKSDQNTRDSAGAYLKDAAAELGSALDQIESGQTLKTFDALIQRGSEVLGDLRSVEVADPLLSLDALDGLLQADEFLRQWQGGHYDAERADTAHTALALLASAAEDTERPAVMDLAIALMRSHDALAAQTALNETQFTTLAAGHETLLAMLDALAADQTLPRSDHIIAALTDLQLETTTESTAEPAAESVVTDEEAFSAEAVAADEFDVDAIELEEEPEAPVHEASQSVTAVPLPMPEPLRAAPAAAEHALPESEDALLLQDIDPEIIEIFFEEADELLEAVDASLQKWFGDRENRLHVENLLRSLHTLKGGARLAGLVAIGDKTHDFESGLIEFQQSQAMPDEAVFARFNDAADEIAADVARVKRTLSGEPEPVEAPVEAVAAEPQDVTPEPAQVVEPEPAAPVAASASAVSETEAQPETTASADASQHELVRVRAGLLEELVNLAGESSIVRARIEQGLNDFASALDEMETTIGRLREQLRRLEIETESQVMTRLDPVDYDGFDPLEMDRYSGIQQLSRGLVESASDMLDLKDTLLVKARESESLLLQQARINTELQEGLMRTRMVPFSRLLPRLRRIVRQVSKELDKDVEFHAFNVEGELDRNLLERMVPPLEHMLRNAVDHGIERAELRRGHGKATTGRIDLRLSREGGDVVIEIADDGAGVDVETVRRLAIERNLMKADETLTDDEVVEFILAPGFSTAKSVTQISGRGVGMDVVASEVKQMGGTVNIVSRPGRGTRFIVRVPFTVAINRALMVGVGDDLYAIPLNTIEGIVLVTPEELARCYGPAAQDFEYAGMPYRVQYLGEYLGRTFKAGVSDASVPMVLVRAGERAVAVHVDSVQGSREIVVKSLGPQFAGVGGVSGATILGDGSVVVILDLLGLIRRYNGEALAKQARASRERPRTKCVLVVDDSVTVRKVTSRLLERQGIEVMLAKDGIEAVAMLQERKPDIMLLDIEMPRMDGFEVARHVRHDARLEKLPIVMISSRTGEKHQVHANELGVNRFLGKPFQENELLSTIDELVR